MLSTDSMGLITGWRVGAVGAAGGFNFDAEHRRRRPPFRTGQGPPATGAAAQKRWGLLESALRRRAVVAVMEPADLRNLDDASDRERRGGS
jgi:hypothetical protein